MDIKLSTYALSRLARKEGFFWLPTGIFRMDGSVLRVPDSIKGH